MLAVTITALALASAGFAIATAHTWASCHSFTVRSYPNAYPQCRASAESHRPVIMAAAGAVFLLLAVGAVYLWTDEQTRAVAAGRSQRRRPARG